MADDRYFEFFFLYISAADHQIFDEIWCAGANFKFGNAHVMNNPFFIQF